MINTRLNLFILLLWPLAFLLAGCAHKPAARLSFEPTATKFYQERRILIASSGQIVSDAGSESDFDKDFFER